MHSDILLEQMEEMRGYLIQTVGGLSDEQLVKIPSGFKNNILWNIGHVVTDQCNMIFTPADLDIPLPRQYHAWFDPGTSPAHWESLPSLDGVLKHAELVPVLIREAYTRGDFNRYEVMPLDDGVVLNTVDESLAHCSIHEAIHVGIIMALRKLVQYNP